jgi:hypothetical protein
MGMSSSNKDIVATAISGAVAAIAGRMKALFNESAVDDESWEAELRELVRREIRSTFASNVAEEAQAERSEYAKSFEEMLRFWRDAEDEERRHIARMDEQLLLDLQSIAKEDFDRLQREEIQMEQVFLSSRESWAAHHRDHLSNELEQAIARRAAELEEHRRQRNELHSARIQELEARHKKNMQSSKELHEAEMAMLRRFHAERQSLHDERIRMIHSVREEAQSATESITGLSRSIGRILERVEEYRAAVDESRLALETERQKSLKVREEMLSNVQGLIVGQANGIDAERRSLSNALVKLEVVQSSIEKQLEQERTWVGQMQTKLERSKVEWDREYRRWQFISGQEKQRAEQRFSSVLTDLQEALKRLEEEAREVEIEGNALRRQAADREALTAKELTSLQQREEELSSRHSDIVLLLAELESRGKQLASDWAKLHEERQQLAQQRAELQREEAKLEQLSGNVRFMQEQVESTRRESVETADRARAMGYQLQLSRDTAHSDIQFVRGQSEKLLKERAALEEEQRRIDEALKANQRRMGNQWLSTSVYPKVSSNPSRMPQRVLREMTAAIRGHFTDPHEDRLVPRSEPSQGAADAASSNYNFTNLVGVSDAETTSLSHQTTTS